jgi:hypothetical protein
LYTKYGKSSCNLKFEGEIVMNKKCICLISLVFLLGMVVDASAADRNWTNTNGNRLWTTAANWSGSVVPTSADKAAIRNQAILGPTIASGMTAVANQIVVGDWSSTNDTITMTGGTLTTSGTSCWVILGYGAANKGTFTISGGTATLGDNFYVGFSGKGLLQMTGGTITVGLVFGIAQNTGSIADVNLYGGTINANGTFNMTSGGGMDITTGTLIVNGDVTTLINTYKTNGWITGYGGAGTVNVSYNTPNPGKTTVTATAGGPPSKATTPNPANSATGVSITNDLGWAAGSGATSHDVYFGTSSPGTFRGNQTATTYNTGTMAYNTTYYWRIDEKNAVGTTTGDVWSFTTTTATSTMKFVLIGDTQKIVNEAPATFIPAMQWLADNAASEGISFVLQMGDNTEDSIASNWDTVQTAWYKLDGKVPYVLNIGNNDVINDSAANNFNEHFPLSRYQVWPSFVSNYDRHNNVAHQFSAAGVNWLVISIMVAPSTAYLDWAENLVAINPDKKVILISHDANPTSNVSSLGKRHANVVFVLCGHVNPVLHQLLTANDGHQIGYVRTCHHSATLDSYFCFVELDTTTGIASFRFYSPQYGKYWDDPTAPQSNPDSPWQWSGFDFGTASTDRNWTNGNGNRLWSTAANWGGSVVPTGADKAAVRNSAILGPIIDASTTAVANAVVVGDWSSTNDTLDMTGGSLTVGDWFVLGYGPTSNHGTFTMSSGTVNVGGYMYIGNLGTSVGVLDISGGTINVTGVFGIAQVSTSTGDVFLDGGTISCGSFSMTSGGGVDITTGTLIVNGDVTTLINTYKTNGWITAYGGTGTVNVSYNTPNAGKTTVTATAGSTPPTFVAAGAVSSGTSARTPALPSGIAANDILLLFIETANQAISITNQNGGTWTQVTNSPQGTGTAGGTSATRLTAFWSRYNGTQGAPTTSDSGNHQIARIIAIRGAATSGNPWNITAGGVEATSDTSGSIPGATTTVANTLVVAAIATSLPDASGTANFSAWANGNLTSVTERTDNTSSEGNGGGLGIVTGIKATAGAYGNTTVTTAASAVKGMMSIAIKP